MIELLEEQIDQLTESIYNLMNGKRVEPLKLPENYPENEIKQFVNYFNSFLDEFNNFTGFMYSISRGQLDYEPPKGKLQILQSFKNLQANLKHLTWKTQQIAKGDFSHKVDFMGDFSEAFNDMTRQLKEAFDKIQEQNNQLIEANKIIESDRKKIDSLLRNILPEKVITELKESGTTSPQLYKNVTVFFSDIVGFTNKSTKIEPALLIEELNELFAHFDQIVNETFGERIKTIGDAYLAVWGMHYPLADHAEKCIEASKRIIEYLDNRNIDSSLKWEIRVGVHSGDVVGGVVGISKFIYDVFGDTVNTASRLESNSEAMRINVSELTYSLVNHKYRAVERGEIYAKGKGSIKMYFIE